jgi:nitrogen fixation-related uncharacterized protein
MSVPALLPILAVVAVLVVLGMAAITWGVDSRSPLADDHNR